jgi:hypothetical protein
MIAARRTVRAIREILESSAAPDAARGQTLAAEYARFCSEANTRLRTCATYVDRGMSSEAVNLAQNDPDLLRLAEMLDFPEANYWQEYAGRRKWPIAELIAEEALRKLRAAQGSEAAREPLVKRYRAAIRRRDDADCIEVLRRLREIEPENDNWLEDLQRFEKKRMTALEAECRRALAADDIPLLGDLLDELMGKWLIPVRGSLKQEIVACLDRARRREAVEEAANLMETLASARADEDPEAVTQALADGDALLAQGLWELGTEQAAVFDEAKNWVVGLQKKQARDKAYQTKLAELHREIKKPRPDKDLEPLLKSLQAFRRTVPADVKRGARDAIQTWQRMQARRRKLRVMKVVTALLLVILGAAAAAWYAECGRTSKRWGDSLGAAFENKDLPGFQRVRGRVKDDRAWLFGERVWNSEEVQHWIGRERELEEQYADKMARRERAWQQLETVRTNGFVLARDEIDILKATAQGLAVGNEDKARLESFTADWKAAKKAQFDVVADRLAELMPGKDAFSELGLGEVRQRVATLRTLVESGREIDFLAEESRDSLDAFSGEIDIIDRRAASRADKLDALRSAKTIRDYLGTAREYADAYPTESLGLSLADVVSRKTHYQYLGAITPAKNYTEPSARIHFEKLIVDTYYPTIPAENYMWSSLIARLADAHKTLNGRWPAVREAIQALGDDRYLTDLWSYEEVDTERTVYAELPYGDTASLSGDETATVVTKSYSPGITDTAPTFSDRTVPRNELRNLRPMDHCRFVKKLVDAVERVDPSESDVFLLERMTELHALDGVPCALLKLKLMRFLADQFLKVAVSSPESNRFREISKGMARIDDGMTVSWLCVRTLSVEEASKQSAELLSTHFDDPAPAVSYRFRRTMAATCMGRGAGFVGMVDPDGGGTPVLPERQPTELWVLRGDPEEQMAPIVAGERTAEGAYDIAVPLEPGEPLFAPGGRGTTAQVLEQVTDDIGVSDTGNVDFRWPASWPSNRQ